MLLSEFWIYMHIYNLLSKQNTPNIQYQPPPICSEEEKKTNLITSLLKTHIRAVISVLRVPHFPAPCLISWPLIALRCSHVASFPSHVASCVRSNLPVRLRAVSSVYRCQTAAFKQDTVTGLSLTESSSCHCIY